MARVNMASIIEELDDEFYGPLLSAISKQLPEQQIDETELLRDLVNEIINTHGEWINVPDDFVEQ